MTVNVADTLLDHAMPLLAHAGWGALRPVGLRMYNGRLFLTLAPGDKGLMLLVGSRQDSGEELWLVHDTTEALMESLRRLVLVQEEMTTENATLLVQPALLPCTEVWWRRAEGYKQIDLSLADPYVPPTPAKHPDYAKPPVRTIWPASPQPQNHGQWSLLHTAVLGARPEDVRQYLRREVSANIQCPSGASALHLAVEAAACDRQHIAPLGDVPTAKRRRALRSTSYLLEHGAMADVVLPGTDESPIWQAAAYGLDGFVKLLAEHGADASRPDSMGRTPLFVAAARGHGPAIAALVEHGAEPNSWFGGLSPLHVAVASGKLTAVVALVEGGADTNQVVADNAPGFVLGDTVGDIAAAGEHQEIAKWLTAHANNQPVPTLKDLLGPEAPAEPAEPDLDVN